MPPRPWRRKTSSTGQPPAACAWSAWAALFDQAPGTAVWDEFKAFRTASGAGLEGHARFEALHAPI